MNIYQLLRISWLKAGIGVNEGATQADVDRFEKKHHISLPISFKEYLLAVNGMKAGETDEHLVSFLSLQAIDQEPNYSEISGNRIEIAIAEFSVYCHLYVLRASRDGECSPVFATDGKHDKQVASSFDEFVDKYLSNPVNVVHCWTQANH